MRDDVMQPTSRVNESHMQRALQCELKYVNYIY
jgi:hypothetical protein